jgi:catechol 2,3-dioxygenase-like lactoylglutathione lyase family enzyme
MSSADVHSPGREAVGTVDMHLEVEIIPVPAVDRSKQFYQRLGWRLDDDVAPPDGLRIIQFTPPGSAASVTFGTGLTTAARDVPARDNHWTGDIHEVR